MFDIYCEIEDLLVVGDKVIVCFFFIGMYNGKKINFFVIDILYVKDEKIMEDWYLEDNFIL